MDKCRQVADKASKFHLTLWYCKNKDWRVLNASIQVPYAVADSSGALLGSLLHPCQGRNSDHLDAQSHGKMHIEQLVSWDLFVQTRLRPEQISIFHTDTQPTRARILGFSSFRQPPDNQSQRSTLITELLNR